MATKDDLTDQLTITQKLASVVEAMGRSVAKIESSYESQTAAVEKLTKAIEQLKNQDLSSLNSTKLNDLRNEFLSTEKQAKSLSGRIKDVSQSFVKKFPASTAAAMGALSGFKQGIRTATAILTTFGGGLTSVIDLMFNVGAAIVAIPFKIFNNLIDMAAAADAGMNELAIALEKIRKDFGDLRASSANAIIQTSNSLKGFSDTGLSTWRVFGTVAERLEHVTKIAKSMGSTFGVLKDEFKQNGGALLAFEKGLDGSGEGMKQIAERAITLGKPMTKIFMDMTKQTLALGKAFDIDQKLIGKDMVKALQDVKHFGAVTVKEIAQASVYARKLGVELDKIVGVLDQFETFDQAAESAAKLSQSFGVSVDAFKLMESQSPAESIDMLRKSFRDAGIDASQFTRQQAKLLAQSTGLDEATARQAFSAQNYGVSLENIKKKSESAEKKTMTQAEAMGKLADSIERLVKQGMPQAGGFLEMFFKGFLGGIQASEEFRTMLWTIKIALQKVYYIGVQLGRLFVKEFPGVADIFTGLRDAISPIPKLFQKVSDNLGNLFKGKLSLNELIGNLKLEFSKFLDDNRGPFSKIVNGYEKFMKKVSQLSAQAIRFVVKSLTSALKEGAEFLKDPKKYLEVAKSSGSSGVKFMQEILQPLIDVVKDEKLWSPLWSAFKDFSGQFFTLLWEKAVKPMLQSIPTKFWLGAAAVIFAPALFQGFVAFGATMFAQHALNKAIVAGVEKALADKVAQTAVSSATGKILQTGVSSGADAAGPSLSKGLWSKILPFITTVPSGAAAATAAAWGAAFGAIAIAAVAAYAANDAVNLQSDFQKSLTEWQLKALNASGRNVPAAAKKATLEQMDAVIKAQEEAMKERKSGFRGYVDSFREATELAFGQKGATSEDLLAKLKRERDTLNAQVEKINAEAAKKAEAAASKQKILDAIGPITIENAAERFKKIDDLSKKIMSKDFDVAEKIKMIQGKLDNVDFTLFKDKSKEEQVNQTLVTLESIKAVIATITDIGILTKKAGDAISKNVSGLTKEGVSKVISSVSQMIESVNTMNESLSKIPVINIDSKLKAVAKGFGLGSKSEYTIKNKDVVIHMNVNVTMNAADLEKAMVLRANSFVRQRLNYLAEHAGVGPATDNNGDVYSQSQSGVPKLGGNTP